MTNTPQGPKRWQRARENARANPNSAAAMKYRHRAETADQVSRQDGVARAYYVLRVVPMWDDTGQPARREYYCSAFCAAMGLQLYYSKTGEVTWLTTVLRTAGGHVFVQNMYPTRVVQCQHCGELHKGSHPYAENREKLMREAYVLSVFSGVPAPAAEESKMSENRSVKLRVTLPDEVIAWFDVLRGQTSIVNLAARHVEVEMPLDEDETDFDAGLRTADLANELTAAVDFYGSTQITRV